MAGGDEELGWFHGKLRREIAESLLNGDDITDGRFLVRESSTAIGDYVLSMLHDGNVVHYQIRKHGGDAFFSIDDGPIIHGLERLIAYYREGANGLVVQLGTPVKGKTPPAECRLHGRTNLLHRATKEGNYTVVDELLKSGYHSLDAKNRDGQTALHLASILGHDDIVERLIQAEANVNTRDLHGLTPLHYACQTNHPFLVRILIDGGRADLQARSCYDGWVALHESASRGHSECVKVLLAANAPANPRTDLNETPKDLAMKNGHWECVRILENYKPPSPKTSFRDWYHVNITREKALALFHEAQLEEGSFLVRQSSRKDDIFVLSVVHLSQAYHYEIQTQGKYFYIDNGPYWDSLEHIVWYHSLLEDGLPTKLRKPVRPPTEVVQDRPCSTLLVRNPLFEEESNISTCHLGIDVNENVSSKQDLLSKSLTRDAILLKNQIGEGEFGAVFCGHFTDDEGNKVIINRLQYPNVVAIKTLRDESLLEGKQSFLKEASVMMNLKHPCIVELIGFCLGPPMMLVQELMCGGSLVDHMLREPDAITHAGHVLPWAHDVADGMVYLEQKHFVHRDLAARNILLTTANRAKITDFGLSRAIGLGRNYYRSNHGGKWPVKWYALESVNFGAFSHASDVWSFGITLWEMYSCGQTPYGDLTGCQAIQLVEEGRRLAQPRKCPRDSYELMLRCWTAKPDERPTFSELKARFGLKLSELGSPDGSSERSLPYGTLSLPNCVSVNRCDTTATDTFDLSRESADFCMIDDTIEV